MGEEMSDIPSWAVPGAKVVCIKAGVTVRNTGLANPIAGRIYTISRAFIVPRASHPSMVKDAACVELIECPGIANGITLFRPLVTRTQEEDVAAFRHLLHDNKEPAYPT